VQIIPPGIDPEGPKNIELPSRLARCLLGWLGEELDKPLVTQVSRFDSWKDQPGGTGGVRQAATLAARSTDRA